MRTRRTRRFASARLIAVAAGVALSAFLMLVPRPELASTAGPCDAPVVNEIACENSLPGNPPSEWDISGSGDPTIQGYATQMSVDQGETVRFKVDTNATDYRVDIYRLGYYGGNGARLITTVQPSASLPQNQPACVVDNATLLIDCGNWAESASWSVPADAVSGIYIARLVRESGGSGASHIIFIVRDDNGSSDLLFQTADTTWQAYNSYGGASLYANWSLGGPLTRAYKVSYNRPFNTRDDIGGLGARSNFFAAEYPMLRWIEANGYDVSYTSGLDTDLRGGELLEHDVFLSVGHDEYWSGTQRANVEAARAAGVHLAFFSGNEVFWKTRWESSIAGTPAGHRTLVSYKETKAGAKIDPSPEWTGTWRDPRFSPPSDGGRPENALTGTIFAVNGVRFDELKVPYEYRNLRIWRNTSVASLNPGEVATFEAGTLGYEWDVDADNGFRNAGQIRMSETTVSVPELLQDYGDTYAAGTATHHVTMYRHASGALVFGAGTAQWSWGLDGEHDIVGTTGDARLQQATVNLFADMGTQPSTLQSGLVAASASTDTTAPSVSITSPTVNQSFPSGTPATIFGTASDVGGAVAGIEVSTDNGATWHPAQGTTNWTYAWTPSAIGPATIRVRATDDSLNTGAAASVDVTVTIRTCPCSIWAPTDTPGTASDGFSSGIELGLKFQTTVDGYITGVRFYKGPTNTGTHTGSLWGPDGSLLASVVFTGETGSGWQQALFSAPVAVNSNQTYVISYYAPNGGFSVDRFAFTNEIDKSPLVVLANAASGGNGVFRTGTSGFPTQSIESSNYWVDVVFSPGASDTIAPIITQRTPGVAQTKVNIASNATAKFSEAITPATLVFELRDPANALVPSVVTYDAPTRTATLNPNADLLESTTYTVTVSGAADAAGNVMAPAVWTFSTTGCPCTIWDPIHVPAVITDGDGQPLEVGVKFRSDVSGYITGARFYKGPLNTGTHVATLWTSGGTKLSKVTFTNETGVGWQQALFPAPVPVTAGTTYVISYYSPTGYFSKTENYFAAGGFPSTPLYAFGSAESGGNGVYKYGASGFPTSTASASNYFVDVVFNTVGTDVVPPVVIDRSPAPGADNTSVTANVTATFSEPINTGTLSFTLRDAANNLIPANVTYDTGTDTATLDPIAGLPLSAVYTATLSATDANGVPMASPSSWSFSTPICPCSLWETPITPETASVGDPSSVELGVRFQPEVDGFARGVRFYKGAGNTGTHTGSLWDNAGNLLATAFFTNESASGWQEAYFGAPVALTAGQTYTVSYHAPNGGYARTEFYFGVPFVNSPLRAPSSAEVGGNGVYQYGASSYPTNSVNNSNYWVDVVFDSSAIDNTAPFVISTTPTAGTTHASTTGDVTARMSEQIVLSTLTFELRDGANALVPGVVSFDGGSKDAIFNPDSDLAFGGSYTATIGGGQDAAGNTMAPLTWSFTTPTCPCTIWTPATVPSVTSAPDASAVELGTRFRAEANGFITAIRFYKGPSNTGVHTGRLWTASGTLLATVTFSGETPTGWQQALLSSPVAVTAGSVYIVSYHAPNGGYARDSFYFAAADAGGHPLVALKNGTAGANGVFQYGPAGSFPTQSVDSTNYWVDAVFVNAITDNVAPTVIDRIPANGTTGVGINANVSATFSEDVQPATIVFELRDGSNNLVPSSVSYNSLTRTVTLDPTAALASLAGYTATVSGAKDLVGNTMAGSDTWSFTTADAIPPTVTARTPAPGATGVSGTTNVTATFSEDVQPASISFVLRDSTNAVVPSVVSYNSTTRVATLNPTPTLASSGVYTATVTAQDLSGNSMAAPSVWSFTVADTVAPQVSARVPAPGATGVSGTANITATFNEAVQSGTISFVLRNSGGSTISSVVTYNATTRTVTLNPNSTLNSSATYTATLSGARDLAGNQMTSTSWSFTIADTVAPTITSRSPFSGQTGVSRTTNIVVTFSEPISPSSSIVITLRDSSGTLVPGVLTYSSATRTATFNPSITLRRFNVHTVTVSGARDAAGNVMTTSTWQFRTQF